MLLDELNNIVFDEIISLGHSCQVATQLKRKGLRESSFPYDWLVSENMDSIITDFENGFTNFFRLEDLVLDGICDECSRVVDKRTNYIYQHIFQVGLSIEEEFPRVKEILQRRVCRLLHILNDKDKSVLFIRTNATLKEQERLNEAIKKYPSNVNVLVINHIKDRGIKQIFNGLDRICCIEMFDENDNINGKWQGYEEYYDYILGGISYGKRLNKLPVDKRIYFSTELRNAELFVTSGLSHNEGAFSWSDGRILKIQFWSDIKNTVSAVLNCLGGYIRNNEQDFFIIRANKKIVYVGSIQEKINFSFFLQEGYNEIIFDMACASSPKSNGESEDKRKLFMQLKSLQIY